MDGIRTITKDRQDIRRTVRDSNPGPLIYLRDSS